MNLDIYQGDTFNLYMRLRSKLSPTRPGPYIDLTNLTPKAEIRPSADSTTVLATFTCTKDNQTTLPGGITLLLSASTTLTLGSGVWDLQFRDTTGVVTTYLRGAVLVTKEVTRGV